MNGWIDGWIDRHRQTDRKIFDKPKGGKKPKYFQRNTDDFSKASIEVKDSLMLSPLS